MGAPYIYDISRLRVKGNVHRDSLYTEDSLKESMQRCAMMLWFLIKWCAVRVRFLIKLKVQHMMNSMLKKYM